MLTIVSKNELEKINEVEKGALAVVLPNNHEPSELLNFYLKYLEDPKIGLLYGDILCQTQDYSYVEYCSGLKVRNHPFVVRVRQEYKIAEKDPMASIMLQTMEKGFYHLHIPDILFKHEY
jgi:hypothetical protein